MAWGAFLETASEVAKESGKDTGKDFSNIDKRKTTDNLSSGEKLQSAENTKQINIDKRIPTEKTDKQISPESLNIGNLSVEQANELLSKGVSPGILDKMEFSNGIFKLKTENSKLAGLKHPDTKVPYKTKIVDILGTKIEGVFPEFNSKFDTKLPENKIIAKDKEQFSYCNSQLKEAVKSNPKLAKQFTERQKAQIESGNTPSGFVWNHNEERGVMQLVDFDEHSKSNHTGGKAIWGGGKQER